MTKYVKDKVHMNNYEGYCGYTKNLQKLDDNNNANFRPL